MFVAMSTFTVAGTLADAVKDAFRARPHLVDGADGFVRMDVISPADSPDEIWLITYWRDRSSFEEWHGSDLHRQSHLALPKGLKLVQGSARIREFEHVCS